MTQSAMGRTKKARTIISRFKKGRENKMANCCSTDYYFYGPSEDVKRFQQVFENLYQNHRAFKITYQKLQETLGLKPEPGRGSVVDFDEVTEDKDGAYFRVSMDDKWHAYPKVFFHILASKFPTLSFAYMEFEPGVGICNIHDPEKRFFSEQVLCDGHFGNDDFFEFFDTKKEAKEFLEKTFKMKIRSLKAAEKQIEDQYEGKDVSMHVYCFHRI